MNSFNSLVIKHRDAGQSFTVNGVRSFFREEGEGEPVICIHGVPSSSFLYRRLLPELAKQGYRGIAFDLPGLGLAERPENFDYSWTGLGNFAKAAVGILADEKFHLVLHDIGGPIGCEVMATFPERIASLTILNTLIVNLPGFKKPWSMRPFAWKGFGALYLKTLRPFPFKQLMHLQGVKDARCFQREEAEAYVQLLKGTDQGSAFLKIMQAFEPTQEKEALYLRAIHALDCPRQIIWGEDDPALTLKAFGLPTKKITQINRFIALPAKHFLQEDQSPAIAASIAEMNQK